MTKKPIETVVTTVVRPDFLQVYVDSTVVAAIPRHQYLTLARKLLDALDMPFMVANTGLGPHAFAEARQLERRAKEGRHTAAEVRERLGGTKDGKTTNPTKENDQ